MQDRRRAPARSLSVGPDRRDDGLHRAAREVERAALLLAGAGNDPRVAQSLDHLSEAVRALGEASLARLTASPAQAAAGDTAQLHTLRLVPRRAAVGVARRWCADTLQGTGVDLSALTDVTGELVGNAVQHAVDEVVLVVDLQDRAVVVSVWDDGPGAPQLLPYRVGLSRQGVGLRLVNQLSERWGWEEDGGGKWVWARLPRGARSAPRPRRAVRARRAVGTASPRAPRA